MPTTINLWVGTIKIKRSSHLRSAEHKKLVPSIKIGKTHVIWWSRSNERLYKTPGGESGTVS